MLKMCKKYVNNMFNIFLTYFQHGFDISGDLRNHFSGDSRNLFGGLAGACGENVPGEHIFDISGVSRNQVPHTSPRIRGPAFPVQVMLLLLLPVRAGWGMPQNRCSQLAEGDWGWDRCATGWVRRGWRGWGGAVAKQGRGGEGGGRFRQG
jgi:hypothetical protein